VVKGVNFVGLKDAGDPVELASRYSEEGADELVFLDITASHEKRKTLQELVRKVAINVSIPFTVGGGISSVDDVNALLGNGADKVSVNSAAVRNPNIINEMSTKFGSQCIVLAVDARQEEEGWIVYLDGGRVSTGIELFGWVREAVDRGAGEVLFTSMDHDGTGGGFANEALARLSSEVDVPVIASGGVGDLEHFRDGFTAGKADAVLAAGVFHYGEYSIREVKQYLAGQGITVRV
jgi:cyclase